jgi:ADP-ribosyl-[dinitrogen reductase] hydrolase
MTKFENIFIGFSLADALGVPVEFESRSVLNENPVKEMRSYGTYHQEAGTWSDDSSLAFCLADSLCEGYDLKDMAAQFVQWKRGKTWTPYGVVFDIGNQTRYAIDTLSDILDKQDYDAFNFLKYDQDVNTNGNGSLMRILPLLFHVKGMKIENQFEIIWNVSALTHPHIRSAISCLIYIKFAEYVNEGLDLFEAYKKMTADVNEFLIQRAIVSEEVNLFKRLLESDISKLSEDEILSGGYVIHTLEASFWCLLNSKSYSEAVFKAINLGDDTDTTATVVGGVAALHYNDLDVPQEWIDKLARIDDIKELSKKFENKMN